MARSFVKDLVAHGYSVTQFFSQLIDAITISDLSDFQKARASKVVALLDERLNDGADEQLQTLFAITQLREACQA